MASAQNYGFVQISLPACSPTIGATSYGVPYQEAGLNWSRKSIG